MRLLRPFMLAVPWLCLASGAHAYVPVALPFPSGFHTLQVSPFASPLIDEEVTSAKHGGARHRGGGSGRSTHGATNAKRNACGDNGGRLKAETQAASQTQCETARKREKPSKP